MENTEITIQHLNQLVLSEDQIAESNIDYSELLEVRLGEVKFAPIWMHQLKTHLKHFPTEGENLFVCEYQTNGEWCALYKHHYFQRRLNSAKKVGATNGPNYHLQKDGQIIGPFTKDEINEKLQKIDLLTTDIISMDDGINWLHIYQLDHFDRRNSNSLPPPVAPNDQIMIPTHDDIQKRIDQLGKNFSETEAVAGLAYIGNVQTGKAGADENWEILKKGTRDSKKLATVQERTRTNIRIKLSPSNTKYTFLLIFSLMGLFALFYTWDIEKEDKVTAIEKKEVVKKVAKVAKVTKPVVAPKKVIKRAPASIKKPKRRKISPFKKSSRRTVSKPTSRFTKSKAFNKVVPRNKKLLDNPMQNNMPKYDLGTDPVENDPVRSLISKETLDPETDYEDRK